MERLVKKLAEMGKAQYAVESLFYDMRDAYLVQLVDGKMPKRLEKFADSDLKSVLSLQGYAANIEIAMAALRAEMAVKLAAAGKSEMTGNGWTVKLVNIENDPGYYGLGDRNGVKKVKEHLPDFNCPNFDGIQSVVVTINGENI